MDGPLIDLIEKEKLGLNPKTVYDADYQSFEKYMD